MIWQCAHGKRHLILLEAHQRYGSVVRIAPDMLSFNTGSATRVIYGSRHANVVKSDFHLTLDAAAEAPSVFAMVDKDKHAFRRRVILQAFTEKALSDASEFYVRYTKVLLEELYKKVGEGWGKVNVGDYAMWWAADVMADLSLGRSFRCLTEPSFRHGIPMMRNGARYTYWVRTPTSSFGRVPLMLTSIFRLGTCPSVSYSTGYWNIPSFRNSAERRLRITKIILTFAKLQSSSASRTKRTPLPPA